jgi:hypothetical protein
MSKKQPPPRNSELHIPGPQQPSANLSQDDLVDQVRHQTPEAIQRNLSALAKQFGFDPEAPDVDARLATAMRVSSRSKSTRGRQPTWLAGLGEELRKDVENTVDQVGCSVNEATRRLSKNTSTRWFKRPPQTLAARYRDEGRRNPYPFRDRIAVLLMCQETVTQNTDCD